MKLDDVAIPVWTESKMLREQIEKQAYEEVRNEMLNLYAGYLRLYDKAKSVGIGRQFEYEYVRAAFTILAFGRIEHVRAFISGTDVQRGDMVDALLSDGFIESDWGRIKDVIL